MNSQDVPVTTCKTETHRIVEHERHGTVARDVKVSRRNVEPGKLAMKGQRKSK